MNSVQSLERLYANVNQAVLGTDGAFIVFANAAAVEAFGEKALALPAEDILPRDILSHGPGGFYCAAEILDHQAGISVLSEDGIQILIIDFIRTEPSPLSLSRAMIVGLRSSAMGLKMSADRCFALISEGKAPEKRTVSSLYHYYYLLLRAITQMDSADQLERGDMAYSPETVDLVTLLSDLSDTVSLLCKESGIFVSFETCEESLPCLADPARLEQLLLNLISNSLSHTRPGGRISLSLKLNGGRAIISVDDTGEGLKDVNGGRLFSLPEENPNALPSKGYGLGLYIAYGIARLHGGTIIIEGGSGTHVRVTLPVSTAEGRLNAPKVAYRVEGISGVLTELAEVLDSRCYGTNYED